jgi:hypothetical protein
MTPEPFSVNLRGRYFATLAMLPYMAIAMLFFVLMGWAFSTIVMGSVSEGFSIVLEPVFWGITLLVPIGVFLLFLIRWHSQRRIDVTEESFTIVAPNGHEVCIPWMHLNAVELRYTQPRLVQCTLVTPVIKFSFSNLEFNLEQRPRIKRLYIDGFDLERFREFLYYINRKAPNAHWKMSDDFAEQFRVHFLPYDLEKMK